MGTRDEPSAYRRKTPSIEGQMERLSRLTDVIYVHVDVNLLSAAEMPELPDSHHERLSSHELAAFLGTVFSFPKATALGIAGVPNNAGEVSLAAAYRLIEGAIGGVRNR